MPKYIDIEKEINEMEKVLEEHKDDTRIGSDFALGAFRLFIDELKQVPAADVAPITHAYWKACGTFDGFIKCSNCEWEAPISKALYWRDKYCPHCGAKMDGWTG